MAATVFLVEDDDAIAETLQEHLCGAGFAVDRASDGLQALRHDRPFDLLMLDGMLPGADGFEVCRHFRQLQPQLPILMLSARDSEAHRVLGLELGADDYLVKPFSMLELVARVRGQLRRLAHWQALPQEGQALRVGPFELQPQSRALRRDGGAAQMLPLREFELLQFLMRHPGEVFSREALLRRVWGAGFDGYEHTVNTHINRLRNRLEADPRQPRWLQTVWGAGYRLSPDPS